MSKNEKETFEILKILESMTPEQIEDTRQEFFMINTNLTERVCDYINMLCEVALKTATAL